MKALLTVFLFFLVSSFSAPSSAYQIKSPLGTSEAVVLSTPNGLATFDPTLIGSAKGYYPDKERLFIAGRAIAVGDVRVDLWEGPTGVYVFPATAQQMRLVSTSASDTLAGTGLQRVILHYLDNAYVERNETHFCQTDIRGTTHDGVLYPGVFILHDSTGTQNGNSDANFPVPIRFPARSDVKLSVFCDAANANAIAPGAFVGWVE